MVLASDGTATFALFLYRDIQWGPTVPTDTIDVGFNFGDGTAFNVPESTSQEGILSLDSTSNISPGNPGTYVYRIDQSVIMQPIFTGPGMYESNFS